MTATTQKVPGRTVGEWLREIYLKKRTGRLDVAGPERTESLFFVGGELYLSPEHPLGKPARSWIKAWQGDLGSAGEKVDSTADETDSRAQASRDLANQLLDLVGGTLSDECEFAPGAGQIRIDLVGPLPTHQVLMESAVRGANEQQLLRRLGGEEAHFQAVSVREALPSGLQLDPQEAFLLSRLEHPIAVGELLQQLELSRHELFERLCRMLAVDLIAPAEERAGALRQRRSTDALVEKFSSRIAASLDDKPLTVEPEQHRELLRNLFSRLGAMNYFELLTVKPHSSDQEVHEAYFELGRLVHPRHSARVGMAGKEGVLGVLFEHATEAYLTLSDPDRRTRYLKELEPSQAGLGAEPSSEQRHEEKKVLARKNYEMASGLASRQEFHSAIQLLEQALEFDRQVEYLTLLAECQLQNPQWIDRAIANYERAVAMRPTDPALRSRLGRLLEKVGQRDRARLMYARALESSPELEEARVGLRRLRGAKPQPSRGGLLDRLRSLVRKDAE